MKSKIISIMFGLTFVFTTNVMANSNYYYQIDMGEAKIVGNDSGGSVPEPLVPSDQWLAFIQTQGDQGNPIPIASLSELSPYRVVIFGFANPAFDLYEQQLGVDTIGSWFTEEPATTNYFKGVRFADELILLYVTDVLGLQDLESVNYLELKYIGNNIKDIEGIKIPFDSLDISMSESSELSDLNNVVMKPNGMFIIKSFNDYNSKLSGSSDICTKFKAGNLGVMSLGDGRPTEPTDICL